MPQPHVDDALHTVLSKSTDNHSAFLLTFSSHSSSVSALANFSNHFPQGLYILTNMCSVAQRLSYPQQKRFGLRPFSSGVRRLPCVAFGSLLACPQPVGSLLGSLAFGAFGVAMGSPTHRCVFDFVFDFKGNTLPLHTNLLFECEHHLSHGRGPFCRGFIAESCRFSAMIGCLAVGCPYCLFTRMGRLTRKQAGHS